MAWRYVDLFDQIPLVPLFKRGRKRPCPILAIKCLPVAALKSPLIKRETGGCVFKSFFQHASEAAEIPERTSPHPAGFPCCTRPNVVVLCFSIPRDGIGPGREFCRGIEFKRLVQEWDNLTP